MAHKTGKNTKVILFIAIALLIAGIVLFPTIKRHLKKEADEPKDLSSAPKKGRDSAPLNVHVKVIQPSSLIDVIRSTGNLIPDEEVDLTFETSGKVSQIFFQEGTSVKKGQLLAKVNDGPLLAELHKLEVQIPLAEDRVFRQKSLLEKDAVSKEAYEQVTTELEKLKADIELVRSRIAQTELRAPFDGIIGLRMVSEGVYASPNTVIAHLTKIIPLKVEFSVAEKYVNVLRSGTPITFITESNLSTYNASIYAVDSRIDLDARYVKIRAIYPNANGRLKPGGTATVYIQSNEIKNALTVPNEAIIAEMGRDIAYLYSNGKAKQVELIKGIRSNTDIQILEGLNSGDTLIISGVMQLRDGLPVIIDKVIQ